MCLVEVARARGNDATPRARLAKSDNTVTLRQINISSTPEHRPRGGAQPGRTAPHVDEDGRALHPRELGGVEEALGRESTLLCVLSHTTPHTNLHTNKTTDA